MLSMKAKYALRALMVLARHEKRMLQIKAIAKEADVPQKFLETILLELKNQNIVDSKRGIFGGYFLNRDAHTVMIGNLIRDHHHTCREDQIELIPGVKPALEACLVAGYRLFVLTNQSGINRGIFTWAQYEACNRRMLELLALPAPGILEIKAAPERPDEPSLYRKPSPRFILEKIAEHGLDPARCWMTGDRVSDWEAGLNAGIRSCAMRSGAAKPEELLEAARRGFAVHDDFPAFVRAELKLAF